MCLTALVLEESILLVTLVHVLSLTVNVYDKSEYTKTFIKPSKVINKPSKVIKWHLFMH